MLKKYLNSQVKLVFKDGERIVVKYGQLITVSDDFVELRTESDETLVPISAIVKVARRIEGGIDE